MDSWTQNIINELRKKLNVVSFSVLLNIIWPSDKTDDWRELADEWVKAIPQM